MIDTYGIDNEYNWTYSDFNPNKPVVPAHILHELDIRGYTLESQYTSNDSSDFTQGLALVYSDSIQPGWGVFAFKTPISKLDVLWSTRNDGLFSSGSGSLEGLLHIPGWYVWPLLYAEIEPDSDFNWFRGLV